MDKYLVSSSCSICKNEKARLFVDGLIASGVSYADALEKLSTNFELSIEVRVLKNHLKNHSPFVLRTAQIILEASKKDLGEAKEDIADPVETTNKVINIGDKMIDNWLFNRPGPKMEVTDKIYVEALKEQGRRVQISAMDKLFDETEKAMVEKRKLKVVINKDALPTVPGPVLES